MNIRGFGACSTGGVSAEACMRNVANTSSVDGQAAFEQIVGHSLSRPCKVLTQDRKNTTQSLFSSKQKQTESG
jgi:hypothetical protein